MGSDDLLSHLMLWSSHIAHIRKINGYTAKEHVLFRFFLSMAYCFFSKLLTGICSSQIPAFLSDDVYITTYICCFVLTELPPLKFITTSSAYVVGTLFFYSLSKGWSVYLAGHLGGISFSGRLLLSLIVASSGDVFMDGVALYLGYFRKVPAPSAGGQLMQPRNWYISIVATVLASPAFLELSRANEALQMMPSVSPYVVGQWFDEAKICLAAVPFLYRYFTTLFASTPPASVTSTNPTASPQSKNMSTPSSPPSPPATFSSSKASSSTRRRKRE